MSNRKFLTIFLMVVPMNLYAYCSEPSAPYSKPSKPSVPYCVNEYSNTHTCDDWEIQSYNCLLYTSPSPRDGLLSRMPSSA